MRFDEARAAKWRKGREERGLQDDPAFHGDAADEIMEEALDLANYADQLIHEKRISKEEAIRMRGIAYEVYNWADRIDRR